MKPSVLVALLTCMNLLLLTATGVLTSHARALGERERDARSIELANERAQLAAERTRMDLRLARVVDALRQLKRVEMAVDGEEQAIQGERSSIPGIEGLNAVVDDPDIVERPKPLEIAIMDPEEFEALQRAASTVPLHSRQTLLSGDMEAVLLDKEWNPKGRKLEDLSPDDTAQLRRLLDAYRFYESVAPFERLRDLTLPQVQAMRAAGAYVEYPKDQGPPIAQGASLTHAEPSQNPDLMRLYYLFPEENPELYHHDTVCRQRGLQTAFQIHALIGGEPSSP